MAESYEKLDYQELSSYKPLFLDYLHRYERLAAFFAADPRDRKSWSQTADRVAQKKRDLDRLAAALREQNRELGADETAIEAIDRLAKGALAVVTGQQVGLLGGPLYTLYKALTAVALARQASGTLGRAVVALFWMDADDHDFEEVRKVRFLDGDHTVQEVSYKPESTPDDVPVASRRLDSAVEDLLAPLQELLPESEFKEEVLRFMAECYRPGRTLPEAFGRLLLRLTRGLGLALVNPADPKLKALAVPLFEREARERSASGTRVQETTQKLLELGYHAQASSSPERLNLFHAGPGRFHIESSDGDFRVSSDGRAVSADDLARLIRNEPERFSPNVLLRPLYQDSLLPTLAYVAGPNELAYFAQLGEVYRHFDIPMPLIVPRASFTIIEKPQARFLSRYPVKLAELRANDESTLNRILKEQAPPELDKDFERARACLTEIVQALSRDMAAVDPTLVASVGSIQGKVLHLLQELEGKSLRALKRKDETLRRQFLAARSALFPNFQLQERELSAVHFLARYGWVFVKMVRQAIDLESRQHILIYA
jgi:bacillithiol biosynthesis cysteine-adding enzyme BshC